MDLDALIKQAGAMQSKMADIQNTLAGREFNGSSGGGMVTAVCNGRLELCAITIDRAVVNPDDVDMLQDLVLAATNDALKSARAAMEREMRSVTGGLSIPGLNI